MVRKLPQQQYIEYTYMKTGSYPQAEKIDSMYRFTASTRFIKRGEIVVSY